MNNRDWTFHGIIWGAKRQRPRFKVCKTQNKHGGASLTSSSFVSAKFSELFAISVILSFETAIFEAILKEKHPSKPLCRNVNKNCGVDVTRRVTVEKLLL